MIKNVLKTLTAIGIALSLSACMSKTDDPITYKTIYQDRVVTKTVSQPVLIPHSFFDHCHKPLKVSQMLDLNLATEDDLVEAFKTSYLKHLQCYKTIQEIQEYQAKVKATYETKQ